jgi:hypothetical protein
VGRGVNIYHIRERRGEEGKEKIRGEKRVE